ncbi:hypothetical protein [Curtobacterium sp. MCBD17_040]|uniref:hypothetical protein n=1 Tax=Curtobacterium sp. MCBD17_040 TaxID=2175674 RepID=UPI000DA7DCE2|nr:hypothetical protein [Curtobacterium sp. MCBD17_040]WIB63585.1 hypothetical protein DEI94_15775 [Curtobacterium sp. MCBD17_040]
MAATTATPSSSAEVGQAVPEAQVDAAIADLQAAGDTSVQVVNPVTGEVLRTIKTPPFHTLIKQLGPGCSTTSVCIPGNPPYGYINAGTVNTNITSRTSYSSGNWTSQVKYTVDGAPILGTITAAKQGPGGGVVFGQYVDIKQVRIF